MLKRAVSQHPVMLIFKSMTWGSRLCYCVSARDNSRLDSVEHYSMHPLRSLSFTISGGSARRQL